MNKGELDYAKRKALEVFDKWNDISGAISKRGGWYYEVLSCIEDAVKIGAIVALCGIEVDLNDAILDYEDELTGMDEVYDD